MGRIFRNGRLWVVLGVAVGLPWTAGCDRLTSDEQPQDVTSTGSPVVGPLTDQAVLGQPDFTSTLKNGAVPSMTTFASPGFVTATMVGPTKTFLVSDTGNNRVMGGQTITSLPQMLGQIDYASSRINADTGTTNAHGMRAPGQVATDGTVLAIADSGNNRVLVWHQFPSRIEQDADTIIGQPNTTSNAPSTTASGLSGPQGVALIGGRLYIADTGNHRILVYNTIPFAHGAAADAVIGQSSFTAGQANRGGTAPSSTSLSSPAYLSTGPAGVKLAVADRGNNRVLIWNSAATAPTTAANVALGQSSFTTGGARSGASGLSQPSHAVLAGMITYVVDTGNNRLLVYTAALATGMSASAVLGQATLMGAATNQGGGPGANTLSAPSAALVDGTNLYVADRGNHRLLRFSAPPATNASAAQVVGQPNSTSGNVDAKTVNGSGFDGIACLATSGNNIIVGDRYNSRVMVFDKGDLHLVSVVGKSSSTAHCSSTQSAFPCPATPSASSLDTVGGCAVDGSGRLYVADERNNRVLVWSSVPTTNGAPASFVLGQDNFTSKVSQSGTNAAGWLPRPTSVSVQGNKLFVTTASRGRMLAYDLPITANHQLATMVVGQPDFTTASVAWSNNLDRFVGRGTFVDAAGHFYVYGSGRLLMYDAIPTASGAAAKLVFGFARGSTAGGPTAQDIGSGNLALPAYSDADATAPIIMNALDGYLMVPDRTANRVVGFDMASLATNAAAIRVTGQTTMTGFDSVPFVVPPPPGGNAFGNDIGPTATLVDPNGQYVWIGDLDGNRVVRLQRNTFANVSYVAANHLWDQACLAHDARRYYAYAYERWPIRSQLQSMGPILPPQFAPRPVPSVDCLLNLPQNASLAQALIAQDLNTGNLPIPYASWSSARKADLQNAFGIAWGWYETAFLGPAKIPLTDPTPNMLATEPGNTGSDNQTTFLSGDDAWHLYVAHVAEMLAVEFGQWVPWSMRDTATQDQIALLDSHEMFTFSSRSPDVYPTYTASYFGFWVVDGGDDSTASQENGAALPAPPDVELTFLLDNDLLRATRLRTIGRMLEWERANLSHFTGGFDTANMQAIWQYPGTPPVSRIISGTVSTSPTDVGQGLRHWTEGCHGTSGFLKSVLRSANVPARHIWVVTHSIAYFPTENLYESHSDDPYNALARGTTYPGESLAISAQQFNTWFGPITCQPGAVVCTAGPNALNNVGRQSYELALTALSGYLLGAYCRDLADGLTHQNGRVATQLYNRWYAFTDLEALSLYTRMDQKLAATGGCAAWVDQYFGP